MKAGHSIGALAVLLTRLAHRLGVHAYLSTSCLHDEHAYCQGTTGHAGAKTPARCKFCEARCRCRCHRRPQTRRHKTPLAGILRQGRTTLATGEFPRTAENRPTVCHGGHTSSQRP